MDVWLRITASTQNQQALEQQINETPALRDLKGRVHEVERQQPGRRTSDSPLDKDLSWMSPISGPLACNTYIFIQCLRPERVIVSVSSESSLFLKRTVCLRDPRWPCDRKPGRHRQKEVFEDSGGTVHVRVGQVDIAGGLA